MSPDNQDDRVGWDGFPIPRRFHELWESCEVAARELKGLGEADRAFGGAGDIIGTDTASRLARDYLFLVQEMQALGESIEALAFGPREAIRPAEDRLHTAGLTGRAILDHLPVRHRDG